MDKILSIQTIKNVFAALGAKTSDDNYGVALLDKTTAEPKGLMGMSDLALVLGVKKVSFDGQQTGFNTGITDFGLFVLNDYTVGTSILYQVGYDTVKFISETYEGAHNAFTISKTGEGPITITTSGTRTGELIRLL